MSCCGAAAPARDCTARPAARAYDGQAACDPHGGRRARAESRQPQCWLRWDANLVTPHTQAELYRYWCTSPVASSGRWPMLSPKA
eukprot:2929901-Prymnesium_polylepis.1